MIKIDDCSMAEHTSFRCGAKAAVFMIPESLEELKEIAAEARSSGKKTLFMGNGSNMLFAHDYDGWVVSLKGLKGLSISPEDPEVIEAEAGCSLVSIARLALENSLTGFEFASGIPGSLGGAVFMNAGAYGGEMKDVLRSVKYLDADGNIIEALPEELDLAYRHSFFTDHPECIVVSAKIGLKPGSREAIDGAMKDLARRRNEKQPVQYPSAGSFFKRPEGYFAGKLIEDAGLKGLQIGGAQVSELHAGFIINRGDASASDVVDLMKVVQETVLDRFGVMLEPEVRII